MRAVVQRSLEAKVTIEGNTVGTIDHGFVVFTRCRTN
jgi:D-tyrosyl-tRNA(Tyr) deacylase